MRAFFPFAFSAGCVLVGLAALAFASPAMAQPYSENFEVDPTANWVINGGPSDESADFFFNYSAVASRQRRTAREAAA
jgi:hypothetical protein